MKFLHLILLIPSLVFGGATVHLGIIDEEIAAVLPFLIEETPPKQVVFIERGNLSFDSLPLGEHWNNIHDDPLLFKTDSNSEYSHLHLAALLDSICHSVPNQLNLFYTSDQPREDSTSGFRIPFLPAKLAKSQELSIYIFHPEERSSETAYVVRLPEMGLQPGIVGPTLLPVLRSIVDYEAKANNSITISMLGSAGAVDPKLKPGDTGEIIASLYLGIDLIQKNQKMTFVPRIELQIDSNYTDENYSPVLFEGEPSLMETTEPAEQRKAYKAAYEALEKQINQLLDSDERLTELREKLNRIKLQSGKEISISTSYFAGASVKQLGQAIGIHNVNMEDSHIIAVINTLRKEFPQLKISSPRLARQVEDPSRISEKLNQQFLSHLTGTSYPPTDYPHYSRSDYVEAIIWGNLLRNDYSKLPSFGNWKFAWDHIHQDPEQAQHFYIYQVGEKKWILDPFFNEISIDMLPTMAQGEFLTTYMIDIEVHNLLKKEPLTTALISRELSKTNKQLAIQAEDLLQKAAKIPIDDFRHQMYQILNKIDYLGGDKTPLIQTENLPIAYNAILGDPTLQKHFIPSLLGPKDIQIQLGYREVPSEVMEAIKGHIDNLKNLQPLSLDLLPHMSVELFEAAKEHLNMINDQIQIRKLAFDMPEQNPIDLYVLVKLVYQAQYPLPRVGFFVKSQESLDNGHLDVWTRQAKWFGNLTGFLNHLPYDYLVSDSSMASDTTKGLIHGVRQILEQVRLQDSIFDRALYKSAIGPALMNQGPVHLKKS
jgi:hypothetical protein